jgi:hypothetical protein
MVRCSAILSIKLLFKGGYVEEDDLDEGGNEVELPGDEQSQTEVESPIETGAIRKQKINR